jgi:hypothetical protein
VTGTDLRRHRGVPDTKQDAHALRARARARARPDSSRTSSSSPTRPRSPRAGLAAPVQQPGASP